MAVKHKIIQIPGFRKKIPALVKQPGFRIQLRALHIKFWALHISGSKDRVKKPGWLQQSGPILSTERFLKTRFSRCMLYRHNTAIGADWNLFFWDNSLYFLLLQIILCKIRLIIWLKWNKWFINTHGVCMNKNEMQLLIYTYDISKSRFCPRVRILCISQYLKESDLGNGLF